MSPEEVLGTSQLKPSPAAVYEFNVFADNFQVNLQDLRAEIDYPESLADDLMESLVSLSENFIAIGTVRDHDVSVKVTVFEEPLPESELAVEPEMDEIDHAAQGNISINSGIVAVLGCGEPFEEANRIELKPANYGVRIFWTGLDTLDSDGFDGDDQYHFQLWPDTRMEPKVLKVWRGLS